MTERIFRYSVSSSRDAVPGGRSRRRREQFPAHARAVAGGPYFYAVKANRQRRSWRAWRPPARSSTPRAAAEIELVQATGVAVEHLLRNTSRRKRTSLGLPAGRRLFAFDSEAELQKLAAWRRASRVLPRAVDCAAPNGRSQEVRLRAGDGKDLLRKAKEWGSMPTASPSMSAASRPTSSNGTKALGQVSQMFFALAEEGVDLRMVNLGGGFPARYRAESTASSLLRGGRRALVRHFGNRMPEVIIEPGRSMVGDAGVIQSEVVLVSRKAANDRKRWVYLDIGSSAAWPRPWARASSTGCAPAVTARAVGPVVLAGPTCDSGRHPLREDRVQDAAVAEAGTRSRSSRPAPTRRPTRRSPSTASRRSSRSASKPRFHTGTNDGLEKAPSPFIDHHRQSGTLKWRRKSRAGSTSISRADGHDRLRLDRPGVLPLILAISASSPPDHISPRRSRGLPETERYGVEFIEKRLTRPTIARCWRAASPRRLPGQPLVEVASTALVELCQEKGALYRHLHRAGRAATPIPISRFAALELRLARHHAEAQPKYRSGPTAVIAHGANPGLVSHS